MTPAQTLEGRAIESIAQVLAGNRIEDSLVEAKSIWPDPDDTRTAWQLGGLANAALGEPVIWLVGLNEDGHSISPMLEDIEPSEWWAKVRARFNGVSPEMELSIRVPTPESGGVVWAMQFITDQGPYVVERQQGDPFIRRAIPWRESASTHPATQFQVHRSLQPVSKSPVLEPLTASVSVGIPPEKSVVRCDVSIRMGILPQAPVRATLLLAERSSMRIGLMSGPLTNLTEFMILSSMPSYRKPPPGSSGVSLVGRGDLSVSGVGLAVLVCNVDSAEMGPELSPGDIPEQTTAVQIDATLDGIGLSRPIHLSILVDREATGDAAWNEKYLYWEPPRR